MGAQIGAFIARLRAGCRIGQSTRRGNRLEIGMGTGSRSFVSDPVRRGGALDLMNRWILLLMAIASPLHAEDALRWSTVSGSAGAPLNVVQAGLDSGPGILLLHGFSQSALSWQAQLNDPQLQQAFQLVAVDLRGHGNSAKPWRAEDYSSETWAGDVAAVLAATGLDRPVLVAWSFGGLVAMHYIRHYGTGQLAGLQLVGGVGQLVLQPPPAVPMDPAWVSDMLADDIRANLRAAHRAVSHLTAEPMPADWVEQTLAAYLMMPPYAKRAIGAAMGDNSDLAARLDLPVRLAGGALDPIVAPAVLEQAAAALPQASVTIYAGAGHSPFAELPQQFNRDLAAFMQQVQVKDKD